MWPQVFASTGEVVPVTVVEAGPCVVTQVKTAESDGYASVQLGFEESKRLNKPEKGHLGEQLALQHLREVRTDDADQYQLGQVIDVSVFKPGDHGSTFGGNPLACAVGIEVVRMLRTGEQRALLHFVPQCHMHLLDLAARIVPFRKQI